jgi:Chagasin family peptidase inhibitor I42
MRKTAVLALGLALASGLVGCAGVPAPDSGDALVATLGEAGGDVILRPQQQLLVRLYLEEGTGLTWRVGKADHLVQLTKAEAMTGRFGRPLPPVVGHGGVVQTFSFKASGRGQGELVFVLRPSRDDKAPPKDTATYKIRVL